MSLFSVNFVKTIFFLKTSNLYLFLFKWKKIYFKEGIKFYRPIFTYNFFFFLFSIILHVIPYFLFFILNRSSQLFIYVNFIFLQKMVNFLKNNMLLNYNYLADMVAIDYPFRKKRFELVYNFLSISSVFYLYDVDFFYKNSFFYSALVNRLFLKIHIFEFQSVFSLNKFYFSSNWLERKIWDFYGIFFFGNENLRRIFLDYGFNGYPLRKDFPLIGYNEIFYNDLDKVIYIEPVEVLQEMRLFSFLSPWENLHFNYQIIK